MQILKKLTLTVLFATLLGCEQGSQGLPFDAETVSTRSVNSEGGAVSSPAGAAIHFPAEAVAAPLTVTLGVAAAPGAVDGEIVSSAFSVGPAGTILNRPAELEIRLSPQLPSESAWLASVVGIAGGAVAEHPAGRVDLATGILTTGISRLGTYVAVIPPSTAVFPVQSIGASLSLAAEEPPSFLGVSADSVTVDCGTPGDRCSGVVASASSNLMALVEDAALLYPSMTGALRIGATSVSGSISTRATLRVLFESGQTAESVEVNALLQPTAQTVVTQTASELRLTNMLHRVSGSASGSSEAVEEVATLTIPKSGATGRISISRTFNIRVAGGTTQPATVSFTFPVQVFE